MTDNHFKVVSLGSNVRLSIDVISRLFQMAVLWFGFHFGEEDKFRGRQIWWASYNWVLEAKHIFMYCVHYGNTEETQQMLELWTDSLNLGDEFKVHNPSNVGKKEGENTPVAFGIGQYRLKTAAKPLDCNWGPSSYQQQWSLTWKVGLVWHRSWGLLTVWVRGNRSEWDFHWIM